MKRSTLVILGTLTGILGTGCDGLNRLHGDRNDGYDNTPIGFTAPRPAVYAVFEGYTHDGESLYLVHGGVYNGHGLRESDVDALGIPKYPYNVY